MVPCSIKKIVPSFILPEPIIFRRIGSVGSTVGS